MDLDGDGRKDILSGSWPGEIYFFRRNQDGTFVKPVILCDHKGKEINVGSASSVFAADWNGDNKRDLLVGTVTGEVYFLPRHDSGGKLTFGPGQAVQVDGKEVKIEGDAAPVAADWDGDGKLDLILGSADGSVVWYRNSGTKAKPQLAAAKTLIGKSPIGTDSDREPRLGEWGGNIKPCIVDWNGDGRLDILIGDYCRGGFGKPSQTAKEKAEEQLANDELPELRQKWSQTFQQFQKLRDAPLPTSEADKKSRAEQIESLLAAMRRYKDEIVVVQEIQSRHQPQRQSHGFVWLFLRQADPTARPRQRSGRS